MPDPITPWGEVPTGTYGLYADDDDVIGLTVAKTYPHGYSIVRTDPPFMDAFDEFALGQFIVQALNGHADRSPGGGTERPGGWVDGLGWVASEADLDDHDIISYYADETRVEQGVRADDDIASLCLVLRWADGTTPAQPAPSTPTPEPGDDAVAFQNGYQLGVRIGSEHHGPCRGLPAPPSTPVERPAAITDEMLRAANTHHGDSCSYCNSAADIDCPTEAILNALAAARPAGGPA